MQIYKLDPVKAQKIIAENIDMSIIRQASKRAALLASENSLQAVALEWYGKFSSMGRESWRSYIT